MSRHYVGVTGLGTYVPAGRLSAADISAASGVPEWVVREKMGITERVTPGPDDHPTAMGVWAAERALAQAGVAADSVDAVISITEEYKEYPVWTAGIKLAYDLGARNAYAYDIGQKCGTAVLAIKQARDLLVADESVNTVLVAGGYRNSDLIDMQDERVRFMYNLGAGGAAAVVQRGHGHEVLGSSIVTDGSFSLDVLVPVGGTKAPLTGSNLADYRLQGTDPAGMKARLEEKSLQTFLQVVRNAVKRSGADMSQVDYLAMLHMKRSAHDYILDQLGLGQEQSVYLSDYGHLGQVDQILSLQLAAEQGKLAAGDLAVLVAAGVGYVWNALALRWRGDGGAAARGGTGAS